MSPGHMNLTYSFSIKIQFLGAWERWRLEKAKSSIKSLHQALQKVNPEIHDF